MFKQMLRFLLLAALMVPLGARAQNSTLTVCDGTANHQYVPFFGFYADEDQHNQLIYPADSLTAMVGNAITQMVFYIDQSANNGSSTAASHLGTWTVSLGITSDTTLSGLDMTTPVAQVYEGYFDCSTGTLTLEFDSPFLYNGGNLLVDLQHEAADYNRWYFLGVSATGASYCYDSQRNFLPKVTFTYGEAPSCFRVQSITASNIETSSMTLTWFDPNNESTTYTLWYTDGGTDTSYVYSISDTTYDITNLTPLTVYYFGVTPDCDATLAARTGSARTLLYCENGACMITVSTYAEYSYTDYYPTVHVFQNGSELGSVFGNAQTIGVCSGDSVVFIYEEPSYDYYTPYVSIQDGAGTTLFDGATDLLFDDDTVFVTTNPCPSCIPPANFTAVVDDEGNATLTWVDEVASGWDIVWGVNGIDPDTVTENIESVSTTSYEIPSLTTGVYKAFVRANCGDEMSAWTSTNINVGIYILAANSTDTLRACSSVIYDDGGADGTYASSQNSTLVIMPNQEGQVLVINGTSNTETIYDYLTIYDGVGTSGEILFKDNVSGVYTTTIPTLRAAAFTIVFQSDGTTVYDGFEINVSCEEAPTCPRPTEFVVDSMTTTSAYLSWTDEEGSAWTVEYGPAGFVQGGNNSQYADFSTNGGVIDNLTPGTYYDFYLMSLCGSDTSWALSATDITDCAPMPVPLTQNFENFATGSTAAFHPCWSKGTNYSYTAYPYVTNDPTATHGKVLYFYTSDSYYSYVVLPEIDESVNINSLQLSFDFLRNSSSYYSTKFYVAALADGTYASGTAFDTLGSFTVTADVTIGEWNTQVFDLTSYMGTNRRLAILAYPGSQYGYYYIDNIDLRLAPSCDRPDSISLGNATTSSLTLNIGGESGNTYLCVLTETNTGTAVDTVTTTALTHTFTDLTPGTKYTVSVSNICEEGNTTVPLYATTYTACTPVAELPYVWDFEELGTGSNSDFDPCWNKGATNGSYPYVTTSNSSKRVYFYTYYNYDYNYAILPEIDESIEINTLELSFDANESGYSGNDYTGHFVVGLIDGNTYDANTQMDVIAEFNLTNSTPETQYVAFDTYTGEKRRIIFVVSAPGNADSYNYLYLDNVNLHLLPECTVPTNVAVDSVTANSATFSWAGSAESYEYVVKNGNTQIATAVVSTNEVTVTGLQMDNDYTFKVRSVCGEDTSVWSSIVSVHIGYCAPSASSIDGQGITNVTFGVGSEIVNNNSRPTSSPFYGIYTSQVGGVYAGTTAAVDITYSTGYTYGTIIWVDWNNNLSFEGNEVVYVGESDEANPTTLNASFVVPPTQDTGNYRMRIAGADSYFNSYITSIAAAAAADPCFSSASYAVSHDYTLHVMPAPDCMAPAMLSVTGTTDNSISISFFGTENTDYQVSISNAAGTTIATDTVEAFAYTFNGLSASTSYTIHVAAICNNVLTDSATVTASTTAVGAPLPYSTDFETVDTTWTLVNGSVANQWVIDTAVNHGGSHALYISDDNGASYAYDNESTSIVYAYKTFSFNAGQYSINFDWTADGESDYDYLRAFLAPATATFTAGVLPGGGTSMYNFTSAVPAGWIDLGGKMNGVSTWQTSENIIELAAASNYNLVFLWGNDGTSGSNPPAAIDNVSIQIVTCTAPDSLTFTDITTTGATINWHSTDDEASWVVSLNGVDSVVNAHPVTFSGLTPGTFYRVSVRAICAVGDTSNAVRGSFWTDCATENVPFVADFATDVLSPCWIDTARIMSVTWAQSVEDGYGTTYGYIYSQTGYTSQNGNDWLISPVINIPANTDYLNLAYQVAGLPYNTSNPSYYARYEVYVSPTGGSSFADFTDTLIIDTINSSDFLRMYFPMTAYAGQNIRVAFRNSSFYGGLIALTNIGVRYTNAPSYGVYGNTMAYVGDTITWNARRFEGDTSTMTLSWTSTMAAAGQGTLLNANTSSASMVYTAVGSDTMTFIASNSYGADTIQWTVTVLDLNPVSVFPYTTSFETTDADNYSWIVRNGDNAWAIGTAAHSEGASALYISKDGGTSNTYDVAATTVSYASRAFDIAVSGAYTVAFDWKAYGESSYDYLRAFFVPDSLFNVAAGILPDGSTSSNSFSSASVSGWIDLGGKLNQSTTWTREVDSINIATPGRYHLVFLWTNDQSMGTQPPAAIDNIYMNNGSAPIECNMPVIDTVMTTENSITLSFTGEAEQYEVAIMEGEWQNPTATTVIDSMSYTFADLTPETQYTVGVRAVCATGIYSEWVTAEATTDMHLCAVPTALTATGVTLHDATLGWTPGEEGQEAWEIAINGTNYSDTVAVEANSYTVSGLVSGVTYSFSVRAVCSETNKSAWSAPESFTTVACETVTNVNHTTVTDSSAVITWTAPAGATTFEIEYGPKDFSQGAGTTVSNINGTTYTITGLRANRDYDVYVRTVCDESTTSLWSNVHTFHTQEGSGIDDVNSANISLYPNPASSTVTLTGIEGMATVTVVDMNGRESGKWTVTDGTLTIDVTGMAQGAYFVRIVGEQVNAIRKLVVR